MKTFRLRLLGSAAAVFVLLGMGILSTGLAARQNSSANGSSANSSGASGTPPASRTAAAADDKDAKPDPALVEKGKARYQAYRCFDCHGKNGEGTDDAPDLIGTRLDAAGIVKFLDKPSADAQAKGMPNVPAGSDDSKALVAYILSIKKAK